MRYYFSMSMFREHWIGGLVTYSIFFATSFVTTAAVSIFTGLPWEWNPTISMNKPQGIVGCFAVAVLFGLWPDTDIKSKSQKIFYRFLFVLNAFLLILQMYLESALLGFAAMLPIISKHRGWTHSKIAMLLLPVLFFLLPIYTRALEWDTMGQTAPDLLSLVVEELPAAVRSGLPFYVAGFIGYATHLHLDGILFQSRKAQRRKAPQKN